MSAQRARIKFTAASALITGGAMAVTLAATPASAQVSDQIVLNIMRECAKIGDPGARLSCYDNNIRNAGGAPASGPALPRSNAPVSGGSAPVAPSSQAGGFGAESIRSAERFEQGAGDGEVDVRVASIRQRQPGIYRLTLEDGAEWTFVESVPTFYKLPAKGSVITIKSGALGGYLMRFDQQQQVRVRRTK